MKKIVTIAIIFLLVAVGCTNNESLENNKFDSLSQEDVTANEEESKEEVQNTVEHVKDKSPKDSPIQVEVTVNEEESIIETQEEGFLLFKSDSEVLDETKSIVTINGYYHEPKSLKDTNTIVLQGLLEGEFIEMIIEGEIIDFEHVEMEWNENGSNEIRILNQYDRLKDETLVIKTYMPEGAPSEKLKWKSSNGKAFEFDIFDYSMGNDIEDY